MRRRYTTRPGVYAILPHAGGFLVTQQDDPGPEIQLPGGGIDPGEHVLPALAREIREETGWSIARPRRFAAYRRFTYMPEYDLWAEKICTIYVAHPVVSKGPPTEPGHTAIWLDAQSALDTLGSPGDREILARYLARTSGI